MHGGQSSVALCPTATRSTRNASLAAVAPESSTSQIQSKHELEPTEVRSAISASLAVIA